MQYKIDYTTQGGLLMLMRDFSWSQLQNRFPHNSYQVNVLFW